MPEVGIFSCLILILFLHKLSYCLVFFAMLEWEESQFREPKTAALPWKAYNILKKVSEKHD